ncbi:MULTISPECIES: hypothetical protein [Acinetobacter]|uniref:hypothetical protein n=1 Tax=Acinetobacter TaxID=469 RepID=UPI0015D1EACE|nr:MULTISPECIES: hypothetical protein [Acinetobacter]MDM1324538.1 hypothetical protein [Acinetobacter pseudolwoffii]
MQKKYWALALLVGFSSTTFSVHASEFDQYLQEKNIIDSKFKIQKKAELNELLAVLSAEDSRTLPLQIDQNTIIEQLQLSANKTTLKGLITTPDFSQFEKDLGRKEVMKMIRNNLLNNCEIFFEHRYQIENPYKVELSLSSQTQTYKTDISQKDCKLK